MHFYSKKIDYFSFLTKVLKPLSDNTVMVVEKNNLKKERLK